MTATVWDKWFWSDWMGDPGVRMSSYAARGLWMEMLAIMAQAEPRGFLVVNGEKIDHKDLARLTAGDPDEVKILLAELERNGVFSRDKGKKIYSRRIVRDEKKARIARKNGKKGGNPSLSNKKDIPLSDNRKSSQEAETSVAPNGSAICQKPEPEPEEISSSVSDTEYIQSESEPSIERGAQSAPDGDLEIPDFLRRKKAANGEDYSFEGRIIRLKPGDYVRWRTSYPNIPDFDAELTAADDYYFKNPPARGDWYFPVSNWLKRANIDALPAPKDPRTDPKYWAEKRKAAE